MSTVITSSAPAKAPAPPHPLREFWNYFSANNGAVAGLVIVVLVLLIALFAPWIAPYPPNLTDNTVFLKPPFWQEGGSTAHLLGTVVMAVNLLVDLTYGIINPRIRHQH